MNDCEKILKVKVFMKSGNVIEFHTKKLTKKHNPIGGIVELSWEGVDGRENLFDIDLSGIDAIITKEIGTEEVDRR